jgi:adenylate kinase
MGQAWSDYERRWNEDRERQVKERDRLRVIDDEKRRQLWTSAAALAVGSTSSAGVETDNSSNIKSN